MIPSQNMKNDNLLTDLNECQLGLHNCETTQRCDNTIGSYACIRIAGCGTGYTLNHNTGECDGEHISNTLTLKKI